MSLENYFTCPRAIERHRSGPLCGLLDDFSDWLNEKGFARYTIQRVISAVAQLSRFLELTGFSESDQLTTSVINEFLENLEICRSKFGRPQFLKDPVSYAVNRYLQYLSEIKSPLMPSQALSSQEVIINEYLQWLEDYVGASSGTRKLRRQYLTIFMTQVLPEGEELTSLTGTRVEKLFLEYARERGRSARRSMQGTLRTFFRYCQVKGIIQKDLSLFIPSLRTYRLGKVPRGIDLEDVLKLISSLSKKSNAGIRDRAMLLMLHTYGVRGAQVRRLRLEDIDWRKGTIRFRACKHGKEIVQPLTPEVGENLLCYLEKARPRTTSRVIFQTARAPYKRLSCKALSTLIRQHCRSAGIELPGRGAHMFRHGFATRALARGESLKTIADMLGHRHISTTFQYTKVDDRALSQVPLPWPGEEV